MLAEVLAEVLANVLSGQYFNPEEYLLADKAYALERHIITPYKEPASRLPDNKAFNHEHSQARVKIEHAFGILKARWPTIYEIPVRIDTNQRQGHERVQQWTMACLVLHNLLHTMRDDETWLQEDIDRQRAKDSLNIHLNEEQELNIEAKRVGITRRNELRNLIAL